MSKKKKTPEERVKACPYYKSSAGPKASKKPEIQCGVAPTFTFQFKTPGEFYKKFNICNNQKETCPIFCYQELENMGVPVSSEWPVEQRIAVYNSMVKGEKVELRSCADCKYGLLEKGKCSRIRNDRNIKPDSISCEWFYNKKSYDKEIPSRHEMGKKEYHEQYPNGAAFDIDGNRIDDWEFNQVTQTYIPFDDNVDTNNEINNDEAEIKYKNRCPYISSIGIKNITCTLHCINKNVKQFINEDDTKRYTSNYCFSDYDKCKHYQEIYKEEMESQDQRILEYRECDYCSNSRGYSGLNRKPKDVDGSKYCFCQVKQSPVESYNTDTVCEYFNRIKRDEAESNEREGVNEVAKTYYTKCGKEFQKSSTADVTGYKLELTEDGKLNDQSEEYKKCLECPFKVKVNKGYPGVFDRWECRAGSKSPNQNNDWIGSAEDKNTIKIYSLHNDFLESVMEYCEHEEDLFAAYNQDLSDCRCVISVSCSQNKKGIAAKKKLIEKFFSETSICQDCNNEFDGGCLPPVSIEEGQCNNYSKSIPVRSLQVIETEIKFYKRQTAEGIIEIGNRLIEAKAQLKHGEWKEWLINKVDFTERTAQRFMKVAEETSKTTTLSDLPISKVYALLDVPAEERDEFIESSHVVDGEEKTVDDMSTRELSKVIKERDNLKNELNKIDRHYKDAQETIRALHNSLEKSKETISLKVKKEMEGKIKELEQELDKAKKEPASSDEADKYKKIKAEAEKLKNKNNEMWEHFRNFENLSELSSGITVFIREMLAPVRYSKALKAAETDTRIKEALLELVQDVQTWCDDMVQAIPNNDFQDVIYQECEVREDE